MVFHVCERQGGNFNYLLNMLNGYRSVQTFICPRLVKVALPEMCPFCIHFTCRAVCNIFLMNYHFCFDKLTMFVSSLGLSKNQFWLLWQHVPTTRHYCMIVCCIFHFFLHTYYFLSSVFLNLLSLPFTTFLENS